MHALGCDHFFLAGLEQTLHHLHRGSRRAFGTEDGEVITAVSQLDTKPPLNLSKMLIELSTQAGQPFVIIRLQLELEGG